MTRFSRSFLIVVCLSTLAVVEVCADDIKVIANSSVKVETISPIELRQIFLEERNSLADGTHVEPVLQNRGTAHVAFLQEIMGRTDDDLRDYYRTLVFTGKGFMPKMLGSDAEVVAYVLRARGAIGYVSGTSIAEGVKTLAIETPGGSGERKLMVRVEPDYPEVLRLLKIGGTVRLRISISAKGNVEGVELLGGNPILGEAAAAAVKKWVYAAGKSRSTAEVSIFFH